MADRKIFGIWDTQENKWWHREGSYGGRPYRATWIGGGYAKNSWNAAQGWRSDKTFDKQTRYQIYEVELKPVAPYVDGKAKFEIAQIADVAKAFGKSEVETKLILKNFGMLFRQRQS